MKEKFWALNNEQRNFIGNKYREKNRIVDKWYDSFYANNRFLSKYSKRSYENSLYRRKKRLKAYMKRYNIGDGAYIESGLLIKRQHFSFENLYIGEKVHIGKDVDIDYTGGLKIGNGVNILESVKILTHGHDFFGNYNSEELIAGSNRAFKTFLEIGDNVIIGARCLIMPGVKKIGENAIISAGAVVNSRVPSNCVVAGNPAKVIAKFDEEMRVYFDFKK